MIKIYELRDPRDETCKPKYVGVTKRSLQERLSGHLSKNELYNRKGYKPNWIKSLLNVGIVPTIHLIEEVRGLEYASRCEMYWIKEFKEQGYILTNSTDGGEGIKSYKHSKEAKLKISKVHLGRKFTKEQIERRRDSRRGYRHSEETKEKMRKAHIGMKYSPEYKENSRKRAEKPLVITRPNGSREKFNSAKECSINLNISYDALIALIKKGYSKKYKIKAEWCKK